MKYRWVSLTVAHQIFFRNVYPLGSLAFSALEVQCGSLQQFLIQKISNGILPSVLVLPITAPSITTHRENIAGRASSRQSDYKVKSSHDLLFQVTSSMWTPLRFPSLLNRILKNLKEDFASSQTATIRELKSLLYENNAIVLHWVVELKMLNLMACL